MENALTSQPSQTEPQRPTPKPLRQRFFHAFMSTALLLSTGLALNYVLNIVLARTLTVKDFGLFGFVHSSATLIAVVATLGFSQSMVRFTANYVANKQPALLAGLIQRSFAIVTLSALSVAGLLVVIAQIWAERGSALLWSAALLVPLALDVWRESTIRGLHRPAEAILPRQFLLPIATLAVVLGLQLGDITIVLGCYLAIIVILEVAGLLRIRSYLNQVKISIRPMFATREWLGVSLPMMWTALAIQGMARLDLILVGLILGMEAAGPYAAAARSAILASIVLRFINLIIEPTLAELYHSGQYQRFRRLLRWSTLGAVITGLPLYLLVMGFSNKIMSLFGETYADDGLLLQILATGQFINLAIGPASQALTMSKHEKTKMIISVFAAMLHIQTLLIFIPKWGAIGAASSTAGVIILTNISLYVSAHYCLLKKQ